MLECPRPYDAGTLDNSPAIDIFTFSRMDFAEAEWIGCSYEEEDTGTVRYDMVRFGLVKVEKTTDGGEASSVTAHCGWCLPNSVFFKDVVCENVRHTRIQEGEVDMFSLFDDDTGDPPENEDHEQ